MLWRCFLKEGLVHFETEVENNLNVMKQHFQPISQSIKAHFQIDNNPNYASKVMSKWHQVNPTEMLSEQGGQQT